MASTKQESTEMTTEELFELWGNYDFRVFVISLATIRAVNKKTQKDLIAKAWGVISLGPAQKTIEFYEKMARSAINREYNQRKYAKSLTRMV